VPPRILDGLIAFGRKANALEKQAGEGGDKNRNLRNFSNYLRGPG